MVAIVRKLIRGRTDKGKRADKRASTSRAKAAKERRERKLNTKRYRNVPVKKATFKKATKPPKGIPIPPKPEKMSTAFKTKSGAKQVLKKFGVPGAIIAGVLATRDTKKATTKKPAAKKETPMKRRFRAGPTAGSGLGSQRRSGTLRGKNVVANPPKRKNKDTAKKPRRPSRPSMTGFRK